MLISIVNVPLHLILHLVLDYRLYLPKRKDEIQTKKKKRNLFTICHVCKTLSSAQLANIQGSAGFQQRSDNLLVCPPWTNYGFVRKDRLVTLILPSVQVVHSLLLSCSVLDQSLLNPKWKHDCRYWLYPRLPRDEVTKITVSPLADVLSIRVIYDLDYVNPKEQLSVLNKYTISYIPFSIYLIRRSSGQNPFIPRTEFDTIDF